MAVFSCTLLSTVQLSEVPESSKTIVPLRAPEEELIDNVPPVNIAPNESNPPVTFPDEPTEIVILKVC